MDREKPGIDGSDCEVGGDIRGSKFGYFRHFVYDCWGGENGGAVNQGCRIFGYSNPNGGNGGNVFGSDADRQSNRCDNRSNRSGGLPDLQILGTYQSVFYPVVEYRHSEIYTGLRVHHGVKNSIL